MILYFCDFCAINHIIGRKVPDVFLKLRPPRLVNYFPLLFISSEYSKWEPLFAGRAVWLLELTEELELD